MTEKTTNEPGPDVEKEFRRIIRAYEVLADAFNELDKMGMSNMAKLRDLNINALETYKSILYKIIN